MEEKMKKIFFLAAMFLFTLMLSISYAQGMDICKNFKYQDIKEMYGQSIDILTGGKLTFQETKGGISYYKLTCEEGFFQWIPAGKREVPQNANITLAFVKKDGKELAYAKLVRMNIHDISADIEGITQNTGVQPSVKTEDGIRIYTWHTSEGITTKMKIYKIKDPHEHSKEIPFWEEVKVAQYFDALRPPQESGLEEHLKPDQ